VKRWCRLRACMVQVAVIDMYICRYVYVNVCVYVSYAHVKVDGGSEEVVSFVGVSGAGSWFRHVYVQICICICKLRTR